MERLFRKYINNECSPAEIQVLLQYFNTGENEELLRSLIEKESLASEEIHGNSGYSSLLETTFDKIRSAITNNKKQQETIIIPFYKKVWFRTAAAVVFIFLLGATAFYSLQPKAEKNIAQTGKNQPIKDIEPGRNNAVLTLSNGKQILLDSAGNGALAQQGNIKILKVGGHITYKTDHGEMNEKPVYNTITTAKGNEYELILADGSKVWLNAESSIRFPASFQGSERKVEITGEAYFEVAHDASKPFKVDFKTNAGRTGEVEVLGTHFNVNAYDDEQETKTTLLEGSVKIKRANQIQMLLPGEQATLTSSSINVQKDVDVSQVVAWKDGYFLFNNTDIQTIMRQVARWYDVEVDFEGKIPSDGFTGKISRNVPLSKFIKVLELNDVHVKTEGRKVIIIS